MAEFTSETLIPLRDPATVAAQLIDHLAEHGVIFERQGDAFVTSLRFGHGVMRVEEGGLRFRATAQELAGLERIRAAIASHVLEFADDERPDIRWDGLPSGEMQADFRELRVLAVEDIALRMRRLTLSGQDLGRFASLDDLHVKLYVPPPGSARPAWPRLAADGRLIWPDPPHRPAQRAYTIRSIDAQKGVIEIDFVLHTHGGPGARFAERAQPGDFCGISGPGGGGMPTARWMLLMGDETALPAIARMLEAMPPHAAGIAIIEVDGPASEVPLTVPAGFALRWLHRGGERNGPDSGLHAALAEIAWPAHDDRFVWAACERAAADQIRKELRVIGLERAQYRVAAYWHHGRAGRD
ncbi:siderophore-interacting protein [Roseomonas hellenica]|uniref:Siderophore-interacting protein n=1 Tax=Plastoroseomonas hellenica TaxID=2687306 RepID=A0ABS5F4X6_9PROT|nr:siderophore-interacting protein [Plastoroseomonas hellenica]MBR0667597.1 siderophore-interacting protein [Plastoroseomonas hellenica]